MTHNDQDVDKIHVELTKEELDFIERRRLGKPLDFPKRVEDRELLTLVTFEEEIRLSLIEIGTLEERKIAVALNLGEVRAAKDSYLNSVAKKYGVPDGVGWKIDSRTGDLMLDEEHETENETLGNTQEDLKELNKSV